MPVSRSFKRIIKGGFISFWRNGLVSFSAILVMILALLVTSSVLFFQSVLDYSREHIEERVDVNIYFYPSASSDDIESIKEKLEEHPAVESTTLVTRDQALVAFKARWERDQIILKALDELGENPLGASLNIRAVSSEEYDEIVKYIESESILGSRSTVDLIDHVNFHQNKRVIDRLNEFTNAARGIGIAAILIFELIALLMIYTTIRLVIYTSREDIRVMRLVGTPNMLIQGPFMIIGALYGIIATILTVIFLYPITLWSSQHTVNFLAGFDIFQYYVNNFVSIFLVLLVAGILVGVLASFLASRKYLNT